MHILQNIPRKQIFIEKLNSILKLVLVLMFVWVVF